MSKELIIDGVNMVSLAKATGTPVMVFSQTEMENKLAAFKKHLVSDKFETQVLYAGKAFTCPAMLELVKAAGCGLDTVSGGEVDIAFRANFPMEKIFFHGNNKTPFEIHQALLSGVGTFVIDSEIELENVIAIANETGMSTQAVIRINPHISAHTHKYDVTADRDSKFGISIDKPEVMLGMIEKINACGKLVFKGFHAHIGSQIFDKGAFVTEIDTMVGLMADLEKQGVKIPWLDIGGGFAATYTEDDAPIPVPEVCETIITAAESAVERYGVSLEKLFIEPGRSIVAEAGITLYTIGGFKNTYSKKYIFIDGGMSDNIRPALYQAKYNCDVANRMDEEKCDVVTVAGKCCESGDVIIEDIAVQEAEVGDVLAVYTTGAYGYSMASNYNRIGRPPVVFVKDGSARCVIRRETYADMAILECSEQLDV
ncbi:MAG: diaminopimelate decarboxylase [Oscillospiraceae bacterium]|nr:diaminopimelate decarboxylase [Oscillospiraceae bacterium]